MKCAYSQTIEIDEKNETPLVNKIKDIHYLIAEVYSDKEPLTDNQKKSKKVFFGYCKDIENALTRLEKLEKAIEICKEKNVNVESISMCRTCYEYNKYIKSIYFIYDDMLLTEEEFNILKEVFKKC